jgi:hypothetical protein
MPENIGGDESRALSYFDLKVRPRGLLALLPSMVVVGVAVMGVMIM